MSRSIIKLNAGIYFGLIKLRVDVHRTSITININQDLQWQLQLTSL